MGNMKRGLEQLKINLSKETVFCFTSDIDWASEYAVEKTLEYFKSADIPLTTFLTHESPILSRAINANEIHAGIHPNFLPGSSQGDSFDSVIDFCFRLLPNAVCFRGHRYFEVNDVYEKLYNRGIRYASNTCTFLETLPPFLHRSGIVQFPIFFEDGAYLWQNGKMTFGNVEHLFCGGLKVVNLHPMHLMLNTPHFIYTRKIKDTVSKEEWNSFDEEAIRKMRSNERGISDFIDEMLGFIKKKNFRVAYLSDFYEQLTI